MVKKKIKVSDILGDNYYVYELTSSNYTPALNGSITITCTMKDVYGTAASGKSITLYQNGTSKGSQTTNSSGVATWSITCSTAGLQIFSIKDTSIEVFVDNKEDISNKVTSLSSSSTDTQYPSAKAVYDATLNLDTLDCINENFTLLSLPQITFTHDRNPFDGSTIHILEGYDKGAYVDWGDGTPIETYESTDTLKHSYSDSVQEHIITIYGNILNLYNNSFENFIRMKNIKIPNGVTSLGDYCFNGCTGLTSVTIPNSVTSLGVYCFSNCVSLTSVTIPNGVTSLEDKCFYNCSSLTNVTIPSSVTSLGNNCFNSCSSLTSVTIPNGVTSLGSNCFSGCSSLTNVTIQHGVRSLGVFCFNGCTGLTSVVIPSSVIGLGGNCFSGCTNLVDYQLYWGTPPVNWSSSLMPNNTNTYFTIPNGTTANYTAKGFPSDKLVERSE